MKPDTRVILICSGKGGVGKTTLTANLGISLARKGSPRAVLDADFGLRNLDLLLGLENRFVFKDDFQNFSLSNTFSKSREGDGAPQLRRPEQQFGVKYSRKIISNIIGPFDLNYD